MEEKVDTVPDMESISRRVARLLWPILERDSGMLFFHAQRSRRLLLMPAQNRLAQAITRRSTSDHT
jgi:hypothetical protein